MPRRKVARDPPPRRFPPGPVAALFAAVEARPADLDARAVLADALSELGDPRGEFIALQLKRGIGGKILPRESALLEAHGTSWLGPIAPLLDKSASKFEHGFLHTAVVNAYREAIPSALLERPEWRTVEVLHAIGLDEFGHPDKTLGLLLHLPNVRELIVDDGVLPSLAGAAGHALTKLTVRLFRPLHLAPLEALLRVGTFPHLRVVRIGDSQPPVDDLVALVRSARVPLTRIELAAWSAGDWTERAALALDGQVPEIGLWDRWRDVSLAADPSGAVRITLTSGLPPAEPFRALLRALGRDRVTIGVAWRGPVTEQFLRELAADGFRVAP